jgi:hypothetical protein
MDLSNSAVGSFHNEMVNLFAPLPPTGKALEVIKRISLAIISPLAYLVLGFTSIIGCAFSSLFSRVSQETYFVRFLTVQANPSVAHLQLAVKADVEDIGKAGYFKGACLYTPDCVQPLAINDRRNAHAPNVGFPFAVLIDPKKAKLHYWSLADMDRNSRRDQYLEAKIRGDDKFKPNGFQPNVNDWKMVHFSGVDAFIKKVKSVGAAAMNKARTYTTAGGKNKPLAELKQNHNEGAITYNPETDVVGILIRKEDIAIAKAFQNAYRANSGRGAYVFKNAFLAYQDEKTGKIVKIK